MFAAPATPAVSAAFAWLAVTIPATPTNAAWAAVAAFAARLPTVVATVWAFAATVAATVAPESLLRAAETAANFAAIADFANLGETDPFYAELARICEANHGLWCKEAEDYLLANAPRVEIGEPKELVKERIIRLGE